MSYRWTGWTLKYTHWCIQACGIRHKGPELLRRSVSTADSPSSRPLLHLQAPLAALEWMQQGLGSLPAEKKVQVESLSKSWTKIFNHEKSMAGSISETKLPSLALSGLVSLIQILYQSVFLLRYANYLLNMSDLRVYPSPSTQCKRSPWKKRVSACTANQINCHCPTSTFQVMNDQFAHWVLQCVRESN